MSKHLPKAHTHRGIVADRAKACNFARTAFRGRNRCDGGNLQERRRSRNEPRRHDELCAVSARDLCHSAGKRALTQYSGPRCRSGFEADAQQLHAYEATTY